MLKPAFSTVACPEWTLDTVARQAAALGFESVELRTFGETSSRIACDPTLTSEEKTRSIFHDAGVEILSLSTSVAFDEPINPPVIGLALCDTEKTVRAAKRAIDLAVALECPYVRVFGFDVPARDTRKSAIERIAGRLAMAADHARNTGVKLVLENGGSFTTAADLQQIVGRVQSPLVGACYSLAAAVSGGDDPVAGIQTLGDRLWVARIKDLDDHGHPAELGRGKLPCQAFVKALIDASFQGPLVFEWDRLWMSDLAPANVILPTSAKTLYKWIGDATAASPASSASPRTAHAR